MDGLLGVAGMIIISDYGSFPHSLLSSTSGASRSEKNPMDDRNRRQEVGQNGIATGPQMLV